MEASQNQVIFSCIKDARLTGCILSNIVFSNCKFSDCKLSNCEVYGGSLNSTIVKHSKVDISDIRKGSELRDCTLFKPSAFGAVFHCCTIDQAIYIRHSRMFEGTVRSCSDIQRSMLLNVECNYVHLSHCELGNHSTVRSSVIHETKTTGCTLLNCQTTTSPLAISRFPPEIQAKILFEAIQEWTGKMSALIQVLRGYRDQAVYQESLKQLYAKSIFRIGPNIWSSWAGPHMSTSAWQSVRKLEVHTDDDGPIPAPRPALWTSSCLHQVHITLFTTMIDTVTWPPEDDPEQWLPDGKRLRDTIRPWAYKLKSLKILSLSFYYSPPEPSQSSFFDPMDINIGVHFLDWSLGVTSTSTLIPATEWAEFEIFKMTCCWEAPKGKNLEWKDGDLYEFAANLISEDSD